nr:T9SS type A sorting domain-containing protein [Dawidia cretensis]
MTISSMAEPVATGKSSTAAQQKQTSYRVRLVDSTGNEVAYAEGQGATSLDTSLVPNGMYYLTATGERGSFSETIVIEH